VDALLNSLLQLTNGQLAGNYLFSGSKTETPPFRAERNADQQIIAVYYEGDSFVQKYRMSNDGMSQINLIGGNSGNDKAFGCFIDTNSGVNVFSTLIKLRDRINDNIMDNSAGDMITEIQSVTDHLITAQTRLGGFQKIAQLDFERVEEQGSYMEKALKDLVDMDPIQSLIEMNNLQVLYQASLAMATRISQTTLLNYM
jgi:flagellin-like hook-associated protein FlgL